MLIANSLRIVGPAREYMTHMSNIFRTCMDGLSDKVSWNDGDSLRLLAKVLSSLDGLEYDARIAISSQFSVMDRTIFQGGEDDSDASSETSDTHAAKEEVTVNTTVANSEESEGILKETIDCTTVHLEAVGHDSPPAAAPAEQEKPSTTEKSASDLPPDSKAKELDQDVGRYSVGCDGNCGRQIDSWSEPFYLCLICPNTDLCEPYVGDVFA
jgi:hypothetical protein